MARPQNMFRGLFAKSRVDVGSAQVTYNSTGALFDGGVRISGARYITANSTGFVLTAESAIPTTDNAVAFSMVSNSTGVAMVVNSTGTTWKYLNTTSVQPT